MYYSTKDTTSASEDESNPWITVKRRKDCRVRKENMPAVRKNEKFGTKTNNNMPLEASTSKGKGPDPKNWGNVRLTREEMDPDSQRVLFDSYKSAQKKNKKGHLNQKRKRSAVKHEHSGKILNLTDLNRENDSGRAMRPIEQVEPNSYIGLALNRLKGGNELTNDGGNDSSEGDKQLECSDSDGYESSDETETSNGSTVTDSSSASSSTSANPGKFHSGHSGHRFHREIIVLP